MAKASAAATEALKTENEFVAGVRANLEAERGRLLRGSVWPTTISDDDGDALRALMASKHMYDRPLLKQLPHNRRVVIRGFDRHLLFWRKQTVVAIASVVSPLEALLDGTEGPPPVGLNDIVEHVRKLAPEPKGPHVIGICATSGFTDEARNARLDFPNTTVVLAEPVASGGWRVTPATQEVPEPVLRMFDPEDTRQKMNRVRRAVEQRSSDLLTGSLAADQLAEQLDIPLPVVEQALDQLAERDPELRVSGKSGSRLLYRGAPVTPKETTSMSLVNKIKELFSKEGDETAKINVLSERRAALAQRRDRLYEDIGKLEEKEADLVRQGKENESQVVRRRLAAQVAQLRKDIARQNTSANMLNQQINIISTDIHNLTLIQQGQVASLPDTQELAENAVRAEEMLETLKADADLVSSLETGLNEVVTSDEERAIMAEFEQVPQAPQAAPDTAVPAAETPRHEEAPAEPDSDATRAEPDREPTDPEAS